ncbi:MAG: hypothetical protein EPN39_00175 [Chitinophagaceae bacterium]|nr:MAG: hypothetical protein EPN39_00175 [Chitinophagaceae bacterium]
MKNRKFSLVVAIAILAGAASAFTTIRPNSTVTYQITGTDGSYYVLGQNLTSETEGVDYNCNQSSSNCKMSASSTNITSRNGNTEVPISDATVEQGTFESL